MCDPCWVKRELNRTPVRLVEKEREDEQCCFCGVVSRSGIYIRDKPKQAFCSTSSVHDEDDDNW